MLGGFIAGTIFGATLVIVVSVLYMDGGNHEDKSY